MRKLYGGPKSGESVDTPETTGFLIAEGGHYSRMAAVTSGMTRDFYWVDGVSVPIAVKHVNYIPVRVVRHEQGTD